MLLTLIKKCSLEKNTNTHEIERESELISKRGAGLVNKSSRGSDSNEKIQSSQSKRSTSSSSTSNNDLGDLDALSTKVITKVLATNWHNK